VGKDTDKTFGLAHATQLSCYTGGPGIAAGGELLLRLFASAAGRPLGGPALSETKAGRRQPQEKNIITNGA